MRIEDFILERHDQQFVVTIQQFNITLFFVVVFVEYKYEGW